MSSVSGGVGWLGDGSVGEYGSLAEVLAGIGWRRGGFMLRY